MDSSKFRIVDVGMYDTLFECKHCGYRCCQSVDAGTDENDRRAEHDCGDRVCTQKREADKDKL